MWLLPELPRHIPELVCAYWESFPPGNSASQPLDCSPEQKQLPWIQFDRPRGAGWVVGAAQAGRGLTWRTEAEAEVLGHQEMFIEEEKESQETSTCSPGKSTGDGGESLGVGALSSC